MATKQFQNAKLNVTHLDLKDDASRSVLQSGENISHSLGKIARWYKDIIWTDSKATTEVFGIVKLSDDYKSESTETVPTSKTLNDVVKLIKQTGGWNTTYDFNSNIEGDENLQNGQFKVTEHDIEGDIDHYVSIKGLGNAAFTDSNEYATAGHTHLYAGSDSVGGAATSANKLNTDAGSITNPIYFNNGIPVACTYSLNATVPSNAIFTDENVTQTATTTNENFEILFSGTADNTTRTEGTRKNSNLTFNPSTGILTATKFVGVLSGNATSATTANKLSNTTAIGSSIKPVYFSADGVPVAIDCSIETSVPSGAVFTDTTYIIESGNNNGQIKVTPSVGDPYNVSVKGLGSAAYTESSTYATAGHTHNYAGSSTVGGVANSAAKLSDVPVGGIGSETKPVFFSGTTGRPVACTYSLNATVPANAIFTDEKVKQSPITTDGSFEILFAGSTGNTEKTEGVGKTTTLTFNPSTGALSATSFSGNGSGLTSLNASNISSGTLAVNRLPGSAVTIGTYGPAAGGTLSHSGTFDVPDFTVDAKGRITGAHTRTFTLPAQYTHPSHTSKASGLYKITVDSLGHVSGTAAVTKSDIPALDYISSTTTRNPNVVLAGPASGTTAAAPTFRALVAADLPASGATAGSYGPSANATPGYGSTFNVPYITVDAKGRVTAISTKTVKIPASDNTNTTYTFATGDNSGTFKVTPSGGTTTNIAIRGISHVAGDSNGLGMAIGAGGLTVLGSGESASALVTAASLSGTNETLYLTSDTTIGFYVNCQTISERKGITLNESLSLYPNNNNVGSVGTSANKWNTMYATTFHGALSGNASTASKWATARTLTLSGSVTGSASIDGSGNVTLTTTTNHSHNYAGSSSAGGVANAANALVASAGNTAVPVTTLSTGYLKTFYAVTKDLSGNMPTRNNANFIIQLNKHSGNYDSQLGFSSNGNIYYRNCNNAVLSASIAWQQLLFKSHIATGTSNGTISIDGTNVSVKGLGSAAYTASSAYATSGHTHSYLPLAGGTMTGNITFAGVSSTTYPALSNQIYFSGSTDWAKILYEVTESDAGQLVFETGDDKNAKIVFRNKVTSGGTYTRQVTIADGVISGNGSGLTSLNASNISSGTLSADRLATSGVTAGSYGPSTNASPAHSGTFNVPYITVDNKGRVMAIATRTITLPASGNTDANVKQSATSTANFRGVILGTNNTDITGGDRETTVTGQGYITNKIFAQPSTGNLYASNIYAFANGTDEVRISLYRSGNSSWRFVNNGGILSLQNNFYSDKVQSWYNVAQFNHGGTNAIKLMTPPQLTGTNRSTTYGYSTIDMAICSKNSWAMSMRWLNNARNVVRGSFGAYGTADNLTYYYWGNEYNATKLRLYPGTGGGLVSQQSNGFRIATNGYGVIFRVDSDNFYILLTDKKTDGSELTGDNWNSKRPLQIGLSSGVCNINGTAATAKKLKYCTLCNEASDAATYPWYRMAYAYTTNAYSDLNLVMMVTCGFGSKWGIFKARARTEGTAGTFGGAVTIEWIVNKGFTNAQLYLLTKNNYQVDTAKSGTATAEIWFKSDGRHWGYTFTVLHEGWRTGTASDLWALSSYTKNGSESYNKNASGIKGATSPSILAKSLKTATTTSNTGWTNNATDDNIIPTMSFMAYWNGGYNNSNSNLQYCYRGRFGTIITAGSDDYVKKSKALWTGTVATTPRSEKSYTLANKATGYNIIKILYTSTTMTGGAAGCLEINGTKLNVLQPVVVGATASTTMIFYFKISSDGSKIIVGSGNDVITITGIYGLII